MGIKGRNLCFFHLGFEAPLGFGKVEVVVFDQVFFSWVRSVELGKLKFGALRVSLVMAIFRGF